MRHYTALVTSARQTVQTDLTTDTFTHLVEAAPRAKQKLTSVQFDRSVIDPANPDVPAIRAKVAAAIRTADAPAPASTPTAAKAGKPRPHRAAPGTAVAVEETCRYA